MPEHHPGSSCQFPRHRPDGDDAIRFSLFSCIEALRQWLKAYSKMRRFRVRPGEVFIAGFGVACTFVFTIAGALAVNAAAIRSKVEQWESNGVRVKGQSEKARRVLVPEQVHMIGHEHPAVNRHPESLCALCQPVRIGRQIIITGKYGVAVIAPLDEVDGQASGTESGSSWHCLPLVQLRKTR